MATEKQIHANRLNAQKCTGPTSAAGKAASSRNALRTGLYIEDLQSRREKPVEVLDLAREYYFHYQPATPVERELCDRLIRTVHLTRRLTPAETSLWNRQWEKNQEQTSPDADHGYAAETGGVDFGRLQRRLNQLDRTYDATWRDLESLRQERKSAEAQSPNPDPAPAPDPEAEVIFSEDAPFEPRFPDPYPEMGSFRQIRPNPRSSPRRSRLASFRQLHSTSRAPIRHRTELASFRQTHPPRLAPFRQLRLIFRPPDVPPSVPLIY